MSDGVGKVGVEFLKEKERENFQDGRKNITSGIDDFAQAIARVAVAQICESVGYQSFQQSALETLSDVGVRYIREIGKTATSSANLANRNECSVFDVIQGLEDLNLIQGFAGAPDVNHCLSGSGVVRDIIQYVDEAEEFPFAYPLPTFPVVKERNPHESFLEKGENPQDEHIPAWLPKFPDPETYVDLNSKEKKVPQLAVQDTIEAGHMKVDRSLLNLQQKLISNGSEAVLASEPGNAAKAQRTRESNPFLAPPLQLEEKEVSIPVLPAKLSNEATVICQNHATVDDYVSVLHQCAPVTEATRNQSCISEEDRRKFPLNGRIAVKFKFGSRRKCTDAAVGSWNEEVEKLGHWFDVDRDGKDDKKRRADQILGETMGNSQM